MVFAIVAFYVVALVGLLLVPLGIFRPTEGLLDRALGQILAAGARVLATGLIAGALVALWSKLDLHEFKIDTPIGTYTDTDNKNKTFNYAQIHQFLPASSPPNGWSKSWLAYGPYDGVALSANELNRRRDQPQFPVVRFLKRYFAAPSSSEKDWQGIYRLKTAPDDVRVAAAGLAEKLGVDQSDVLLELASSRSVSPNNTRRVRPKPARAALAFFVSALKCKR